MKGSTTHLRAVEPEDADFMYEVENDMESWIYGETVAPLSHEQLMSYAMTYTADPHTDGQLRLILEKVASSDDAVVGNERLGIVDLYGINERHGHGFIGIYIKPSSRGKGFGSDGVFQMARLARQFLNLDKICAKVADINTRSLNFFQNCGFKECGILPGWLKIAGVRHDLHLLEFDLSRLT